LLFDLIAIIIIICLQPLIADGAILVAVVVVDKATRGEELFEWRHRIILAVTTPLLVQWYRTHVHSTRLTQQNNKMALLFIALAVFYRIFVSDAFTRQFLYNHLNLKRNHQNGGSFLMNRLPIYGLDTLRRGQISSAAVVESDEVSIKNPVTLQPIATEVQSATKISRILGSQELLMLPRQYRPNETNVTFPPVIHVSVVTLNKTPSIAHFFTALQNVLESHPLLSCRVAGDGEPASRIDLLKMVRRGNPNPETFVLDNFQSTNLGKVVIIPSNGSKKSLVDSWSKSFQYNLDRASFNITRGPLWSLEIHKFGNFNSSASDQPCALLFAFNHAISDQRSVNMLIDHFIAEIASLEEEQRENQHQALKNSIPMSMEECTLGGQTFSKIGLSTSLVSLDTLIYVSQKAAEGLKNTPILPDNFIMDELDHTAIDNIIPSGESRMMRHSMVEHRTLSKNVTTAILEKCRQSGVTFSNVMTAAMAFTSSDFVSGSTTVDGDLMTKSKKSRTYKVLQSLDLRRFGIQSDPCETIGCHAGSHDLLLGPIPDFSGSYFRSSMGSKHRKASERFWNLAKHSRDQTKRFIESGGAVNAVRVFDFAMSISDMNNLVHMAAYSKSIQGRAYSAGVTNAGVYEKQFAVRREGDKQRSFVKSKHGRYEIEDIFFAGGHGQSGSLYHVSLLTVNEELKLTFHPVSPIVNRETSKLFADAFVDLLKVVSLEGDSLHATDIVVKSSNNNLFPIAASVACLYAIGIHWDAWLQFFSSLATIKENTNPEDFWDALNFWIFFAVAHPILQPALWISEILHGSPGPYVADLIPLTFLLANVAFIAAMVISKSLRNTMNIVAFSAFLAYVGAGLDGQAGVEDYNLQLNDSYKNQEVKGCPAYGGKLPFPCLLRYLSL